MWNSKRAICAALAGAVAPVLFSVSNAMADGVTDCTNPSPPRAWSTSGANYDGTGRCTGTSVDAWRVQVGLSQEDVNWGPIPNDWTYVANSYTTWSTWAAPGGSRYKEGYLSCSMMKNNWSYKSRFRYETVWNDGHDTYGYYHSAERDLC
jgi:hypothetical protein